MRFNEFIIKAPIINEASWWNYDPGTYFTIGDSKNGQKLLALITAQLEDFDPGELLEKIKPTAKKNLQAVVIAGRGEDKLFLKRPNNKGNIVIIGSATPIGTALNHSGSATGGEEGKAKTSKVNLGDISEGVLGAALYAKLLARTKDGISDITSNDVWNVLNQGTQSTEVAGVVWNENSADIGGAIDKISYRMRIKAQAARALKDPNNFDKINNSIVESSVSFVNGRYGSKYAEAIYMNRKADEIGIVSDGLSEQKADPVTGLVKKTDVFITSTNEEGQKVKERLPISLKAGSSVKQFGQVSGKTFDKMIGLLKPFNIDVSSLESKWNDVVKGSNRAEDSIRGAEAIFPDIANMLNAKLKGPKAEAMFVHNIASAIHYFAASNDPKVRLVQLIGANKVHVLNTNLLFEKIARKDIDLQAFATTGDGKAKITIKDINSGKPLISLRSYHTDNAQRNIVEMEKLMKELCGVEWEKEFGKEQPDTIGKSKQKKSVRSNVTNVAAPTTEPIASKTLAAPAKVQHATPEPIPTTPTTAEPAQPMYGKNINTLSQNKLSPANQEDEVEMEDSEDKDLVRLRHLSGIVGHMGKHV
jgi:hypothetical protein